MLRKLGSLLRGLSLRLILGKKGYARYKRSETFHEMMEAAAFVYTRNPRQGLRLFVAATYGHPDEFIQGLRDRALTELSDRMSATNNPERRN